MIRLMLMYNVDFTGFMEDPERAWNEISSTCDKPPLENEEKRVSGIFRLVDAG